ncbi:MAG: GNAT family N-acetyltransferase [Actinomycetota bacterium]|nr:GNAT family N-acetyltransferase [Actinomycetota bacterium]
MSHRLEFLDEPGAFLEAAGEYLAGAPVVSTVVTTYAERLRRHGQDPVDFPRWWLVVRDDAGVVVGAGMRTAPFLPHPVYLLPMPDEAAAELARVVSGRGEELGGVNGALPAVRVLAEEYAGLTGRSAQVEMHTRLFEVTEVVAARPVVGSLRLACADYDDDVAVALEWYRRFAAEAAEQAGREHPVDHGGPRHRDEVLRRIDDGCVWFWVGDRGERVHLTGANPPAYGVVRVGPVFTPRQHRGRGYASAAVAAVSQRLLRDGNRVCLFTDQANPTSNHIYTELGYRAVVDQANLVIG